MDFLSHLPKIVHKSKKRVGRGAGSGRGSKSGRGGTRHQSAREDIPIFFEGGQNRIIKKFPLIRGKGKNKSKQVKPLTINLTYLKNFLSGEKVNPTTLYQKGIIKVLLPKHLIKILGDGEVLVPLTVEVPLSKKAKEKIESAGGKYV